MAICAVYGCKNYLRKTKDSGIKYFRFPKEKSLCDQWINACKRVDKINIKNARICSIHFSMEDFQIPLRQQLLRYTPTNSRNLKKDAIPKQNLPLNNKQSTTGCDSREERYRTKERRILVDLILSRNEENINTVEEGNKEVIMEESEVTLADENQVENNLAGLEEQNRLLQERVAALQQEIQEVKLTNIKLEKEKLENEKEKVMEREQEFKQILSNYFTPGQIKRILNPSKKLIKWGVEDIAAAISLRAVSPKAYRYLRNTGYPLPALSTLRAWAASLNVQQGLLHDVLQLMKEKGKSLTELERVTVLSFDEIYISTKVCIEPKTATVLGPHKTCQIVFARGLFGQWKQPIFYKFDQPMTREILVDILTALNKVHFKVVAITSDMGNSNQSLWSKLNVGYDKECFFNHSGQKIFVFADAPHLLKLVRNHFIDNGFNFEGNYINKTCVERLIEASTNDVKIAHKIGSYHLSLRGSERQKVRPAAQLFSATTSNAITWCGKKGFLEGTNWQATSKLFKLLNDWFDIFNSKAKYGSHAGVNGFGTDLHKQEQILNDVSELMSSITVGKHKKLIPFQKGILLNNRSLVQLYGYLKDAYNIEYLITYRLNQDIVENFFSYIRGMGATNDHPTSLEFMYRLRWYILGKHSAAVFTMNKNTEEDVEEVCLLKPLEMEQIEIEEPNISTSLLRQVTEVGVSSFHKMVTLGVCKQT